MKNMLTKMLTVLTAALIACSPGLSAAAETTDLRELISEETVVWGTHTVIQNKETEIFDIETIPERWRKSALEGSLGAINTSDRLIGLAFRLNGELPDKIGGYTVYSLQGDLPQGAEALKAYLADDSGCAVASYSYYQAYIEGCFGEDIRYASSRDSEVFDTSYPDPDGLVFLLLDGFKYKYTDWSDQAKEAFFLGAEEAFRSCEQLSYLGEARHLTKRYCYDFDGIDIYCTDADAAAELYSTVIQDWLADHDWLTGEAAEHNVRGSKIWVFVPRLKGFLEYERELRALVRQDPRVVSAQILYSCTASVDADESYSGIVFAEEPAEETAVPPERETTDETQWETTTRFDEIVDGTPWVTTATVIDPGYEESTDEDTVTLTTAKQSDEPETTATVIDPGYEESTDEDTVTLTTAKQSDEPETETAATPGTNGGSGDAETGTGSGDDALPQTGNNAAAPLMIVLAAAMLTGAGAFLLRSAGVLRRREQKK